MIAVVNVLVVIQVRSIGHVLVQEGGAWRADFGRCPTETAVVIMIVDCRDSLHVSIDADSDLDRRFVLQRHRLQLFTA